MPNFSSLTRLDKINQLLKHNAKRSQRRYDKFCDFWDENGMRRAARGRNEEFEEMIDDWITHDLRL